jgi:hypothetical protein
LSAHAAALENPTETLWFFPRDGVTPERNLRSSRTSVDLAPLRLIRISVKAKHIDASATASVTMV